VTSPSAPRKTVRCRPRSRVPPVKVVLRPASSAAPMIPVRVPTLASKARLRVGRNGAIHRRAAFDVALPRVRAASVGPKGGRVAGVEIVVMRCSGSERDRHVDLLAEEAAFGDGVR
jgi:hypothetical protein